MARAPGDEDDGLKGMSLWIVHTKRMAMETEAEDADGSELLMTDLVESVFCAIAFS